ncbi:MAG: PAS domain S-box protein [Methylococcales bacterium]|nr:PAS domain S-box protein [Methylococcales bacterium]
MKKYQFALDQYALVSTADLDGKIIEVNDKFCEVSGFSRGELLNAPYQLINTNYHNKTFFKHLWHTINQGNVWHGEVKNKKKNGEIYWVNQTIVPLLNSKKDCYEYLSIASDISSQKNQHKELLDNWNFMEKVTSTMAQGVYVLNVEGLCTFWNTEAENLLGWSNKELINQNLHKLIHYQNEQGHTIAIEDCPTLKSIQNKQAYTSDNEVFTHKEGYIVPISITAVPLLEDNIIVGSVAIFNDISSRKQNEKLLNNAIIDAEQASQAKSDFLANMSHEIRTPMNGIIGMTDLALDTDLNDEQREYLDIVKESACSLLAIINDILDFSKIDAGNMVLERHSFHFENLLTEILLLSEEKAHEKNLTLRSELSVLSKLPAYLVGDSQRLRQILVNLLDNAIKFTDTGDIKLNIQLQKHTAQQYNLLFSISDTGIGIEKDKHATIFDSFLQADSSVLRKFGGTGLGLSISKQLVELMGGKIWLESEEEIGSTFSFAIELQNDDHFETPAEISVKPYPPSTNIMPAVAKKDTQKNALMVCHWEEVLKRLGDLEIVEIVIEMFFEEYQGYLDKVKQALNTQNSTLLKNELHTLKGVCSALGAERVETLIKTAELTLQDQTLDDLPKMTLLVDDIEKNIIELNDFLKEKLKK